MLSTLKSTILDESIEHAFKMIHSSPKNAKSRVCQSQVYYLHTAHLGGFNASLFCDDYITLPKLIENVEKIHKIENRLDFSLGNPSL